MPTTQSEDPNEQVDHPRRYNAHVSGIECIELIEHLPANLAMAVKYVWRCGLKQSEHPLQELQKALWYTKREEWRGDTFELDPDWGENVGPDIVWRSLARKVIQSDPESTLTDYLEALLDLDFQRMTVAIDYAISKLNYASAAPGDPK